MNAISVTLLVLCSTATAYCETNFFPILIAGKSTYTNARITSVTASDAIVWHDGGGSKVALTNLTEELQRKLGYDPELARKQAATAKERQRTEADQLQSLKSLDTWRGEWSAATVDVVGQSVGLMPQCSITVSNSTFTVLLSGLPNTIREFFKKQAQVDSEITRLSSWNDKESRRLSNLEDYLPSTAAYDSPAGQAIRQMNIDAKRLNESVEKVKDLVRESNELERHQKDYTLCRVRQTAKTYGGFQIWECQ